MANFCKIPKFSDFFIFLEPNDVNLAEIEKL